MWLECKGLFSETLNSQKLAASLKHLYEVYYYAGFEKQ